MAKKMNEWMIVKKNQISWIFFESNKYISLSLTHNWYSYCVFLYVCCALWLHSASLSHFLTLFFALSQSTVCGCFCMFNFLTVYPHRHIHIHTHFHTHVRMFALQAVSNFCSQSLSIVKWHYLEHFTFDLARVKIFSQLCLFNCTPLLTAYVLFDSFRLRFCFCCFCSFCWL